MEVTESGEREGFGDAWCGGHFAEAARAAPEVCERTAGDVERAVGAACESLGDVEDAEQVGADGDRALSGACAEAHQFARGLIVAQRAIEIGDAIERGAHGGAGAGFVRGIHDEPHLGAHVRLGELDARQRASWSSRLRGE